MKQHSQVKKEFHLGFDWTDCMINILEVKIVYDRM